MAGEGDDDGDDDDDEMPSVDYTPLNEGPWGKYTKRRISSILNFVSLCFANFWFIWSNINR